MHAENSILWFSTRFVRLFAALYIFHKNVVSMCALQLTEKGATVPLWAQTWDTRKLVKQTVARNRKGERGEEVKCMRSASFVATKTLALCRPVYRSMVRVFNFSSCCHWTVSILIIFSARIHPQQIKNRSSSFRIATYPILFTFCFGFFNALEKMNSVGMLAHTRSRVSVCGRYSIVME